MSKKYVIIIIEDENISENEKVKLKDAQNDIIKLNDVTVCVIYKTYDENQEKYLLSSSSEEILDELKDIVENIPEDDIVGVEFVHGKHDIESIEYLEDAFNFKIIQFHHEGPGKLNPLYLNDIILFAERRQEEEIKRIIEEEIFSKEKLEETNRKKLSELLFTILHKTEKRQEIDKNELISIINDLKENKEYVRIIGEIFLNIFQQAIENCDKKTINNLIEITKKILEYYEQK